MFKDTTPLTQVDCDVPELTNMIFSSTDVTGGRAQAIVVATGMNTELGTIQKSVGEASGSEPTPLQKKMDDFGDMLQVIGEKPFFNLWQ